MMGPGWIRPRRSSAGDSSISLKRIGMILILLISGLGLLRSFQITAAQMLYREAKYGAASSDANRILGLCERAYQYYPYHYYFSIWAAESAYYYPAEGGQESAHRWKRSAEYWCDVGLRQNFFNDELRSLKAELLACESLPAAIAFWEAYVEWDFWNPYNHSVLLDWYIRAGEIESAMRELRWLEGSAYYSPARVKILDTWRRERSAKDILP